MTQPPGKASEVQPWASKPLRVQGHLGAEACAAACLPSLPLGQAECLKWLHACCEWVHRCVVLCVHVCCVHACECPICMCVLMFHVCVSVGAVCMYVWSAVCKPVCVCI